MKIGYIAAILVGLLLIVGCSKPAVQEAAPVTPTAPAVEPVAPEPVAEPVKTVTGNEPVLDKDQATIDRLTKACKAGNAGVCVTLKNKYGITVEKESAAQQEAAELPAETGTA